MRAGSTFHHSSGSDGVSGNSWGQCDAGNFELRVGPNYDRNKQKGPSPESIMELVGVDLIQCESRIDNIASKVSFPPEWSSNASPSWKFPHIFVVNVQLPSEFTTSFFTEITDGPGWSLVFYYRIRQEVALSLAAAEGGKRDGSSIPPSNAARLWERYCNGICSQPPGASNPWIGRFKVIINCLNIEQFGLPNFIASYNSKPILIRNTASYYRQDGYMEIDVNVHKFGSVPKKALQTQIDRLHLMEFNMGFCIESRCDAEMPECIFGCVMLDKPNKDTSPNWKDVKLPVPHLVSLPHKHDITGHDVHTLTPIPPIETPHPPADDIEGVQRYRDAEADKLGSDLKSTSRAESASIHVLPHNDADHGAIHLASFMRHRNALLDIWNMLAGHDTSFGGASPTDLISSLDLISPSGDPLNRNPAYRQVDTHGNVVQHLDQLFETAKIIKPVFEKAMLSVASECDVSSRGNASSSSPTSTRSGLVLGDIKSLSRVAEKIRQKYLHVHPGPACSWVLDMLRASFVCDTQEQIQHVFEAIESSCEIIRVKNRFLKPTAAGFRDILLNVVISSPGAEGSIIRFVCEVQITHIDLRQYEIEHNTRALYHMFWPLLQGSDESKEKRLEVILKIVSLVSPLMKSMIPDGVSESVASRFAKVKDIVCKHYDREHISEDIDTLRSWRSVLEVINDLVLAEKNQRKVVKMVSQTHSENSLAVANEYIHLGHILKLQKKYKEALDVYERGVKTLGEVLGERIGLVHDALLQMAEIKQLDNQIGVNAIMVDEVNNLREHIFPKAPHPVAVALPVNEMKASSGEKSTVSPTSSVVYAASTGLINGLHSETHHSAYDVAPQNYNTKPPEMLEPVPDLWDLVSSSGSEFGDN